MAPVEGTPMAGHPVVPVLCLTAAALLVGGAGGSAHLLDQPLQRFQRERNTGIGHAVFDEDRAAETHGHILVGLEPGPTDLH